MLWVYGAKTLSQGEVSWEIGDLLIGDANVLRAFHPEDGIPALEAGSIVP